MRAGRCVPRRPIGSAVTAALVDRAPAATAGLRGGLVRVGPPSPATGALDGRPRLVGQRPAVGVGASAAPARGLDRRARFGIVVGFRSPAASTGGLARSDPRGWALVHRRPGFVGLRPATASAGGFDRGPDLAGFRSPAPTGRARVRGGPGVLGPTRGLDLLARRSTAAATGALDARRGLPDVVRLRSSTPCPVGPRDGRIHVVGFGSAASAARIGTSATTDQTVTREYVVDVPLADGRTPSAGSAGGVTSSTVRAVPHVTSRIRTSSGTDLGRRALPGPPPRPPASLRIENDAGTIRGQAGWTIDRRAAAAPASRTRPVCSSR